MVLPERHKVGDGVGAPERHLSQDRIIAKVKAISQTIDVENREV